MQTLRLINSGFTWLIATILIVFLGMQVRAISAAEIKTYEINELEQVHLKGPFTLEYVQGSKLGLTAEGDSEDLALVIVEEKSGKLSIELKKEGGFWKSIVSKPGDEIKFTLTAPTVEAIKILGSGQFKADSIEGKNFDLIIKGSAKASMESLTVDNLNVEILGSGSCVIGAIDGKKLDAMVAGSGKMAIGKVDANVMDASVKGSGGFEIGSIELKKIEAGTYGSGDFKIGKLKAKDVTLAAKGSGNINVDELDVKKIKGSIMGSGSIRVAGEADEEDVNVWGSGKFKRTKLDVASAEY